ncbi:unnamed protein product [Phaedon cochleariae]|uniref:CCHC-type domain-containing protein n=1 Tax=Phaedon cochleariae TaxID=80249 RepID=A0A9N9X3I9_PHACE|nr:unnamed protein product [Phaedon cochleariae]
MKLANDSNKNQLLKNLEYETFIPLSLTTCRGVVRDLGTRITEDEVLKIANEELVNNRKILEVRRLTGRIVDRVSKEVSYGPTGTFIFTFEGKSFPKYVSIYNNKLEVKTYIKSIMLCAKCFRFNHSKNMCRSRERCVKCGKNEHSMENCPVGEARCLYVERVIWSPTEDPKKKSSEFIRQQKINEIMSCDNLTYYEASKKCPSGTSGREGPYTQIVDNTNCSPLRQPDNEFSQIINESGRRLRMAANLVTFI